jgi:hypothetical protein
MRKTMNVRPMLLACAGLAVGAWSLTAQGDTVQGIATVGTTKVPLSHGMAVAYQSPDGPFISVVLSDKPVDAKGFAADTKVGAGEPLVPAVFEGAWKAQHSTSAPTARRAWTRSSTSP